MIFHFFVSGYFTWSKWKMCKNELFLLIFENLSYVKNKKVKKKNKDTKMIKKIFFFKE